MIPQRNPEGREELPLLGFFGSLFLFFFSKATKETQFLGFVFSFFLFLMEGCEHVYCSEAARGAGCRVRS